MPPYVEDAVKSEVDEIEIFEPKFEEIDFEMDTDNADDYPENDAEHEEITSGYQTENANNQSQGNSPLMTPLQPSSAPVEILPFGKEAVKTEPNKIEILEPKFEEAVVESSSESADDYPENYTDHDEITSEHQTENVNQIQGASAFESVEPVPSWQQQFPTESGVDSIHPSGNSSRPQPSEAPTRLVVRLRNETRARPFKCDMCKVGFLKKAHLIAHMRRHTGMRSHKCDICHASFSRSFILAVHKRAKHTGEKPYKCDVCQAAFSQTSHLTYHKRAKHTGERPYKCDLCQAAFSHSSNLTAHNRAKHTGERPYKCDVCQAAFAVSSSLTIHKRAKHTGERPYKCDVCQAAFVASSSLTNHKRAKHTGEQPYKCDVCPAAFIDLSNLTRHRRAMHTGDLPII